MTVCGGIGDLLARLHSREGRVWPSGATVDLLACTSERKAFEDVASRWGMFSDVRFGDLTIAEADSPMRCRMMWERHSNGSRPIWDHPQLKEQGNPLKNVFLDLGRWESMSGWTLPIVDSFPSFYEPTDQERCKALELLPETSSKRLLVHPFPHAFSRGVPFDFWHRLIRSAINLGWQVILVGSKKEHDMVAASNVDRWDKHGEERSILVSTVAALNHLSSTLSVVDLRGKTTLGELAAVVEKVDLCVIADSCVKELAWDRKVRSILVEADDEHMYRQMMETFFWGVASSEARRLTMGSLIESHWSNGVVTFSVDGMMMPVHDIEIPKCWRNGWKNIKAPTSQIHDSGSRVIL